MALPIEHLATHGLQIHLAPFEHHLPLGPLSRGQPHQHVCSGTSAQLCRRSLEAQFNAGSAINGEEFGAWLNLGFTGGRIIQWGDDHDMVVVGSQAQLQPDPTHRSLGGGPQGQVVARPQQPGIRIINGGQHRLNGPVGIGRTVDGLLKGLLAQSAPMHLFQLVGIPVALINESPSLHH